MRVANLGRAAPEKKAASCSKTRWRPSVGSWLNDAEDPDDRLDYGALEPGESVRWTFIACVPKNATMVRAYSEIFDEESEESHESIKVLAVPRSAEKG